MRCNFFPNPNVGMQGMQSLLVLVIAQIKTLRKWYLANATSYGHWGPPWVRNSCEALNFNHCMRCWTANATCLPPSFHVGVAAHYYDCQDHFPHLQDSAFMAAEEKKNLSRRPSHTWYFNSVIKIKDFSWCNERLTYPPHYRVSQQVLSKKNLKMLGKAKKTR